MIRSFVYLLYDLPNLFLCTFKTIININRNDFKSKLKLNPEKRLLILGNGPSLKKDIERINLIHGTSDIFAVNNFANTEYFEKYKPKYYFLFDRMFWSNKVNKNLIENREILFSKIKNINWDMQIILNKDGYKKIKNYFKDNKHLKVIKVNHVPCNLKLHNLHLFALKKYLCTPNFGRGVLILALWYGILIKKKNIEIYGADFSQFKDFEIDQYNNETVLIHNHFYKVIDGQKKNESKYKNQKVKKIHERLYNMSLMFKQMFLLSRIAELKGINVVNYSNNSYLDCFPRPTQKNNKN